MPENLILHKFPCGDWKPAEPDENGIIHYIPPPHCSVDIRRIDDFRSPIDIRNCKCPEDWYNAELHPWIISQYSGAHEPAFDFHTTANLRLSKDIRHPDYNNIIKLILHFGHRLRPGDDLALLYQKWLDIDTAEGVGLDHNGEILGIDRLIEIPFDETQTFGFYGSGRQGFGQAPFSPHPENGFFIDKLDDPHFRRLIWFISVANRSNDSAADINRLFRIGLGFRVRKRVGVIDLNEMRFRILVQYDASPLDLAIIRKMARIVKPVGVRYDLYKSWRPETTFGFNGSELQPFNQGTFNNNTVENLSWKPEIPPDDEIFFGFHGTGRTGFNTSEELDYNVAGTFNSIQRRGQAHAPYLEEKAA